MKRLLVLNGSHSDIPLIEAGKRLGFHVLTSGNDPSLVGHRLADAYHPADFSDKDAMLKLARELRVDAVCACANDFGALSAAYVAERLGLPGHDSYETTLTLHHKHRFKEFALTHGITTPPALQYSCPEEAHRRPPEFPYPLIVKPVDLTGGKGVSRVSAPEEYEPAIRSAFAASRIGRFVVEQFICGTYHSFSTLVVDRKVVFSFSDNEYFLNSPFLVSTSAGPATGIEKVKGQLIQESERIADLLSLCDGIFHIQYVDTGGKAWILEITRRCSGDFYPYPVKLACGVDWAEWIVRAEAGHGCRDFPTCTQRGFFGRHCVFSRDSGVFTGIAISRELQDNVVDRFFLYQNGDRLDSHKTNRLAGVLFLRYNSADEMTQKAPRMNELVSAEVAQSLRMACCT